MSGDNEELKSEILSLKTDMKEGMTELTNAVKTLIVLQTEYKATRDTVANHDARLDRYDERIDSIETEMPRMRRFLDRWDKISLAVTIAIVIAAVGTILGVTYG